MRRLDERARRRLAARWRAHRRRSAPREVSRRAFLGIGPLLLGLGVSGWVWLSRARRERAEARALVRPPTASHDDQRFQALCTRCGMCGVVCENGCIRFHGADESVHGPGTPYLDVRRRSCTLCMRCTQICPTGALTAVEAEPEAILDGVDMGKALIERDLCISYQGRLCGYCHDACPFPSIAIRLSPPALPVILDGCVGCGRCVEQCPQVPSALSIVRRSDERDADA